MIKKRFARPMVAMTLVILLLLSAFPGVISEKHSEQETVLLDLELPEVEFETLFLDEGVFTSVSMPGVGVSTDVGVAKLPQLTKVIEIPYGSEPVISVKEVSWISSSVQNPIMPVQTPYAKDEKKPIFVMDESYYSSSSFQYSSEVSLVETGSVRGRRFATLQINPIQYLPSTGDLRIIKDIVVSVSFESVDYVSTQKMADRYDSASFDSLYETMFENSNQFYTAAASTKDRQEGYLIVVDDAYESTISSFADHKTGLGFDVTVATTTDTGTTTTAIKSYIQNAYDTWATPPTYVLLAGDTGDIPTFTGSASSSSADVMFVQLEGDDLFPEMHIGRFSFSDTSELQAMIDKTMYYESGGFSSIEWLKKAAFCASTDNYDISEGTHNYVISNYLEPNNWTTDKLYTVTYNAQTSDVTNAVNDGRHLLVFSGHGSQTSWADGPSFSQSNVESLANTGMYPFVFSHSCLTASFHIDECFGETWLRVADKGAITFWGGSESTYWDEDDILEKGMFQAWFDDGLSSLGEMTDKALFYVYENYSGGGRTEYYYEIYTVLGDPSVHITTEVWDHNIGVQTIGVDSYLEPDAPTTINVSVNNNGKYDESSVLVTLEIDGSFYDSDTIAFIQNKSSEYVEFAWTPTYGPHDILVNVSMSQVEDYYPDNERTVSVIAGPEITVGGLAAPGIAKRGDPIDISATVSNIGATDETITVDFLIEGSVEQTTSISLLGGESQSVSFGWTPLQTGNKTVGIEASIVGPEPDETNNADSAIVLVMDAVFVDSFELGAPGWSTDSSLWHLTESNANSPTHSFWCADAGSGSYSSSSDESLYSPAINLSGFEDATLNFWQWFDIEDGYSHYDGGNVKISTDGGSSWTLLGSYENPYSADAASSSNAGISGEPCFTGTSSGWEEVFFDLSSYVGQEIMLRFHFGSDGSVQKTGWLIDDILIYGTPAFTLEINNVQAMPDPQETGGAVNISCTIVSDNALVSAVVDIDGPSGPSSVPLSLFGVDSYYYEASYAVSGEYTFSISVEDDEGNTVVSPTYAFTIGIPPEISDLLATPAVQSSGGPVNITCTVSDNGLVSSVDVQIVQPDSSVVSMAMVPLGGGMYYYNQSYALMGVYSVSVTAEDEHGNQKVETTSFGIGTVSVDFDLEAGWNFIGIPFQTTQMASNLASQIPGSEMISTFNATTQGYDTYFVGGPSSFDFALEGGRSYFVLVDSAVSVSLSGTPVAGVSIPLELGWNAITWCESNPTLASTIGSSITGAEMLSWFNAATQGYETYFVGGPSSFDFTVEMGKGLFVLVNQPSTWTS